MEDHGSGAGHGMGCGLGLGAGRVLMRRRVDLKADRRRKRHRRVRVRVMLYGGDIFTRDSSLPDESIDGWSKANGSGGEQNVWLCRRQIGCVVAHVILSDCEISRVGSTCSDD